jgi:hypothetical protein
VGVIFLALPFLAAAAVALNVGGLTTRLAEAFVGAYSEPGSWQRRWQRNAGSASGLTEDQVDQRNDVQIVTRQYRGIAIFVIAGWLILLVI